MNHFLPDTIAFAYRGSVRVVSRADALFVGNVGGSREGNVDVESSEKKRSE